MAKGVQGPRQGGKSKPTGKAWQRLGNARSKAKSDIQQQRLRGRLCLACGASDHWLRDCPFHNIQNAQVASASYEGLTLDAEGGVFVLDGDLERGCVRGK